MALFLLVQLFVSGLFITPLCATAAHTETAADTTIAGQRYSLIDAEKLLNRIQRAAAPIHLRQTAVLGRLHAPTAGIDTVRVPLHFDEVLFLDEVTLNNVSFLGSLHCERTIFNDGLSLVGTHFKEAFTLRESQSGKHLNLKSAHFEGDVDLSDSYFAEPSSFIEVHFSSRARFNRTSFGAAAYFEKARFSGQTEFNDVRFVGVTSFKDATWEEDALFTGARFRERAIFWRTRFLNEANFTSVRADGEISFNAATFAGTAKFTDFTFAQAAHFADIVFDQALFHGSYFRKEADFSDTEGNILRFGSFFNRSIDLRHSMIGTLDLRPNKGADSTFAHDTRVYLGQAYFDRILVRWAQLQGRLASSDSASFTTLEPVYASLHQHFLLQGLERDAEAVHFKRLDHRRSALGPSEPKRWALELWRLSSDYGTNPQRLVLLSLGFILIFALLYRLAAASIQPINGEGQPTLVECIGFSIHIFTHAGYRTWRAKGKLKLLTSFEALIGWVSLGLLFAIVLAHLL